MVFCHGRFEFVWWFFCTLHCLWWVTVKLKNRIHVRLTRWPVGINTHGWTLRVLLPINHYICELNLFKFIFIYLFDFVCPKRDVTTGTPQLRCWLKNIVISGAWNFIKQFMLETFLMRGPGYQWIHVYFKEPPFSLYKVSRISMYFNHPRLKCRTSKLVSSVLAAHRARWHGGTYAKPTLLGGDGIENLRIW